MILLRLNIFCLFQKIILIKILVVVRLYANLDCFIDLHFHDGATWNQ
jgi:hypothetical protein